MALPGRRNPFLFTCARLHAWIVRGAKHLKHLHHIVQPVVAELVENEREERDDGDHREDELGVFFHLANKGIIGQPSLCRGHSDLKQDLMRVARSRSGCLPFLLLPTFILCFLPFQSNCWVAAPPPHC